MAAPFALTAARVKVRPLPFVFPSLSPNGEAGSKDPAYVLRSARSKDRAYVLTEKPGLKTGPTYGPDERELILRSSPPQVPRVKYQQMQVANVPQERRRAAMRVLVTAGLIAAGLSMAPIGLLAATGSQSSQKSTTKVSTPASHATTGVVKSIDDTTLVITKQGKKPSTPMTFVIDPSTQKQGTIEVGSSVSVRYHADGKTLIASAIAIQQPKPSTSHSSTPKKSS